MNDPTRRRFLVLAGAGAAAVGAASVASIASEAPAGAAKHVGHTDPLVAYVRDAHSGELTVMLGERQVVVHDPDLTARIARAVSA